MTIVPQHYRRTDERLTVAIPRNYVPVLIKTGLLKQKLCLKTTINTTTDAIDIHTDQDTNELRR